MTQFGTPRVPLFCHKQFATEGELGAIPRHFFPHANAG
jgi:hypothetical protein